MGGLADEWQLPALRELFGEHWDIRRVHHMELIAVPRDGAGDAIRAMSAAVLRVLIGEAEWRRVIAKYRPAGQPRS